MLYIVCGQNPTYLWRSGQTGIALEQNPQDVTELEADGDELTYIVQLFTRCESEGPTIPMTRKIIGQDLGCAKWFGGVAQTIYYAIQLEQGAYAPEKI